MIFYNDSLESPPVATALTGSDSSEYVNATICHISCNFEQLEYFILS